MANRLRADFGDKPIDIVVHSLANGSEVTKPLLDTSRSGYLGAIGTSAYSNISMINRLSPLMRDGGSFMSLTYMASERAIPGYGGGMSSAKAALESDTRVLAYEVGRNMGTGSTSYRRGHTHRGRRARSASSSEWWSIVRRTPRSPRTHAGGGRTRGGLSRSPLASGITGTTLYVDKGYHAMGMAVSPAP